MVKIIQERPNYRSFGEKMTDGLGRGLETFEQYQQMAQEQARQEKFHDYAEKVLGIQTRGLPIEKAADFAKESYKQQAKFKNQQQLMKDFGLEEYFGEQEPQEQPIGEETPFDWETDELVTTKPREKKGLKEPREPSKKLIPESKIAAMAMINKPAADVMQKHNDRILEQQKTQIQEEKKDVRAFHKESEKFDDELYKNFKSSEHQLNAIDDSIQAIKSGKIKPSSLANIFRAFGDTGRKISDAILSGEEATLLASIPAFLEGRKELFGVRLSDADLKLLQDKLPEIGKSKEANMAILNLMKKSAMQSQQKYKIGQQIKKDNKGLRPLGYRDRIEEEYSRKSAPVKVINPNTGKVISIPAHELSKALEAGATLYQEENEQF
jgi:hypothetical protein